MAALLLAKHAPSFEEAAVAISLSALKSPKLPQPNLHWLELTVRRFPYLFWLVLIGAAILTGFAAAALMLLLREIQHTAWDYHSGGEFLDAVQASSPSRRIVVLTLAGVFSGIGAQVLTYIGPGGEVSQAVWRNDGQLNLIASIARGLLAILSVGMGASLGREAAPQLVGGALASTLSELVHMPPASRQVLVAITGGAGLACVYNMPLGGAVYVLEVLLASLALPLVLSALASVFVATSVGWVYFGRTHTYHVELPSQSSPSIVFFAVVMGVVAGFSGAAFMQAVRFVSRHKPKQAWSRILAPIITLAGLGALAIPYPQLLGNGYDVTQKAFTNNVSLYHLAVLTALKPLVTAACVESGVAGGLFTPTLTFGALLGGLLGKGWQLLWPELEIPKGTYAVLGSASLLAVSLQGPLAAAVFAIELMGSTDVIIVPVLLSGVIAVLISRFLHSPSVYTARLHRVDNEDNEVPDAVPLVAPELSIPADARGTEAAGV